MLVWDTCGEDHYQDVSPFLMENGELGKGVLCCNNRHNELAGYPVSSTPAYGSPNEHTK